ncbi:alpha/beta fold hydrolase [Paenibacillus phytohabitans]|uniref:alpha/beta fold hydrolase n=1 Tax=Paenibacillus phytohabitans TaxID=2654978 RepID=UPI003009A88E
MIQNGFTCNWMEVQTDGQGRGLYYKYSAYRAPAVIFISGLGDGCDSWSGVQENIAQHASTLAYDRPGTGTSPGVPGPRSCQDLVEELYRLLALLDIKAPYILVGHSFGGLVARLFACCYPERTAGIVLIDAAGEYKELTYEQVLPPQHIAANRAYLLNPSLNREQIDKMQSYKQISAARGSMPNQVPLSVITRGLADEDGSDWPAHAILEIEQKSQAEFLELSAASRQLIAPGSGHYIHHDQPGLVIDEIIGMIQAHSNGLKY